MPAVAKRLFLIDGYSDIFRAFYAIRGGLSNSKGQPTNAVYGFLNMLRRLLREEAPELVGIALDVAGPTVRDEKFAEYKANRAPMPEDLKTQIPWIRSLIEAYRIPILELDRYEADDVLGTLARQAAAAGYEVVVVSADKDLMQLVAPGVSVYHTGRDKLYDPAAVEADFGVPPERIADVLALKGDAVDNVPGVPGIGDKGARDLVRTFGGVEQILERVEEVQRKSYREGLANHREQALLSKELATIHTDLPIELDAEALHRSPPDEVELRRLFSELEFFSLLDELGPTVEGDGDGLAGIAAEEIESAEQWSRRSSTLAGETLVLALGRPALGLAVCAASGPPLLVDFRRDGLRATVLATLSEWLSDREATLAGHDLKEVLRLSPAGPTAAAELFDTLIVSHLVRPALHGHTLEDLALETLGTRLCSAQEAGWSRDEMPLVGGDALRIYAGERLELVRRLLPVQRRELGDGALARVAREIEAPLIPVLVGMEQTGVRLDRQALGVMSSEVGAELAGLEEEIYQLAGERFNLNSPQQLGVLLFETLGYPVLKKTRKTRSYSTSAETLQELATRGYPIAERLLRYRELTKLKSTYIDALPLMVAGDGRLHTLYNQVGAATGRLSSTQPNLQNIPVRSELGQRIRRAFVAADRHLLLAADYSQIELRVLAHIAEDAALIDAFQRGQDIHASTAAAVFGGAPELVTPEQRRAAKVINFGILYGMSPFGLARNLGISRGDAERFIDAYLARFPGVQRYMEETLALAARETGVATLYGRVRALPDIHSRNHALRENARRMAINARIQGTAADLQKRAMVAVDHRLRRDSPDSRLLLTVHDELVLEVPAGQEREIATCVRAEMEGVEALRVPLVVDTGWGPSWGDAK